MARPRHLVRPVCCGEPDFERPLRDAVFTGERPWCSLSRFASVSRSCVRPLLISSENSFGSNTAIEWDGGVGFSQRFESFRIKRQMTRKSCISVSHFSPVF